MEAHLRDARIKVEESRASIQNERSVGTVMKTIARIMQTGSIPGIYGRLGDLGCIDPQFDVAVSTCCRALDYIVVDTVNTAQQVVQLLRTKKLGTVTCLVLEQQQRLIKKMKSPFDVPRGSMRLFDLIQVQDKRILPAFFFALGNAHEECFQCSRRF